VALAGIGTAVALYPVLKRQNQGPALGLVGSRILEAAGILAGVACLLAIVSLQTGAGSGALVTGRRWPSCMTGSTSSHEASCRP
jgi:Domain of unknown function (DUF4386)